MLHGRFEPICVNVGGGESHLRSDEQRRCDYAIAGTSGIRCKQSACDHIVNNTQSRILVENSEARCRTFCCVQQYRILNIDDEALIEGINAKCWCPGADRANENIASCLEKTTTELDVQNVVM